MAPPVAQYLKSQLFLTLPYPSKTFTGRTIIVTGSNTGLGLEAARHFVRLDAAKVILAVRSIERGKNAAASIQESTHREGVVEVWELDLEKYSSVKAFAERAAGLDRLDVVESNAGVLTRKFSLAEDNEKTITVNVISTFLLGLLLLPKLRETAARHGKDVVLTFTGSLLHWLTDLPERKQDTILEELVNEQRARMGDRYNVSKLMELLIVRELAEKLTQSTKPGNVIVSIVNPGTVLTDLNRESRGMHAVGNYLMKKTVMRPTEEGSRTLVHAAYGGQETHGQYLDDCKVGVVSDFARSEEGAKTQKRLWAELAAKLESIQPGIMSNI